MGTFASIDSVLLLQVRQGWWRALQWGSRVTPTTPPHLSQGGTLWACLAPEIAMSTCGTCSSWGVEPSRVLVKTLGTQKNSTHKVRG